MTLRQPNFPTLTHAIANALLIEKGQADQALKERQALVEAAVDEVRRHWAPELAPLQAEVDRLDQQIKALARNNRLTLFGELAPAPVEKKLDLPHGWLVLSIEAYVVKPRKVDVLANLERYGFEEAIKRTAAVDWDVLEDTEKWPNEALGIIGTRRETKETFAYEVQEAGPKIFGSGPGGGG